MVRHLRSLLAMGLALGVCACAAHLPAPPAATTSAPGEGFTNSQLRVALYQWSTEDEQVKNVCLKNSLVLFTFLQECGRPEKSAGDLRGELAFQGCTRRSKERNASFLVHPTGHDPWDIAVGFSETSQQFTLAATPSGTRQN